ncbi:MAG: M28 family peptidase [bacterium]
MSLIVHVRHLSETIGPRPSASENERKAALYVKRTLEQMGIPAQMTEFKALPTYSFLYMTIYTLFLAAALLVTAAPAAALALSALGILFYLTENSTLETLARLFPKRASHNAAGALVPDGEISRTVIVSAHLDSSRSALFFHPALVKGFRSTFLTTIAAIAWTFALGAAGTAAGTRIPFWLALPAAAYMAFTAALLIHREIAGRHTHGAVDNASGVAAMLGAAELLKNAPPHGKRVVFVATGSEESGLFGMVNFLRKNRFDPETTRFLNIDHVGTASLSYTTREGMIVRRKCDPEMIAIAGNFPLPSTGRPPLARDFSTMLTDLCAPLVRGFNGMSIMAFNDDGTLPNWHWKTDVAQNISEANLTDAAALAAHIIKNI